MKGSFEDLIVDFLFFEESHELLGHLGLLELGWLGFGFLRKGVFVLGYVQVGEFLSGTVALWEGFIFPLELFELSDKPRHIDRVFDTFCQYHKPLSIRKYLIEFVPEHVSFGYYHA